MIIDIHAHTTDKELWGLHTRRATLDELERSAAEHSIGTIILLATYFPFKKGGLPNRELLRRIGDREKFLMFASLDAMNDLAGGIKELRELKNEKKIVGIKLYPGYQDFRLTDEKIFPVFELAAASGLPVAVHSGELHHCCPKNSETKKRDKCGGRCYIDELEDRARPREIVLAAEKFPEVKFIMCHLGNPFFGELREVMRSCPNVHSDISGQFLSGTAEDTPEYREILAGEIREFLNLENGTERLMFGSDFPIQSYRDSVALVKMLGLTKDLEENIFRKNAERIIDLKEAGR